MLLCVPRPDWRNTKFRAALWFTKSASNYGQWNDQIRWLPGSGLPKSHFWKILTQGVIWCSCGGANFTQTGCPYPQVPYRQGNFHESLGMPCQHGVWEWHSSSILERNSSFGLRERLQVQMELPNKNHPGRALSTIPRYSRRRKKHLIVIYWLPRSFLFGSWHCYLEDPSTWQWGTSPGC